MDNPTVPHDADRFWPGHPDDPGIMIELLDVAWQQVEAYAPTIPDGAPVQFRWVMATVLQARELWNAGSRDGDVIGFDAYAIRVRPLSSTVKALLRPHSGRPRLG